LGRNDELSALLDADSISPIDRDQRQILAGLKSNAHSHVGTLEGRLGEPGARHRLALLNVIHVDRLDFLFEQVFHLDLAGPDACQLACHQNQPGYGYCGRDPALR